MTAAPAIIITPVGTAPIHPTPPFNGTVAGTKVVVGTIPCVNGAAVPAMAPEKAGACTLALGSGVAVVFPGFRTLV